MAKLIEIDDAGGGCFLGPEVMVIHRLESAEVWYLYIPPPVRERVLYATKALKNAFIDLGISKTEPVELCRGELFDLFETYLAQKGYTVIREKVSHATDRLAEEKFMEILYSYGLPRDLRLQDRNYQEFYELVSLWYHTQAKKKVDQFRKVRLRPPIRSQIIARKYPNLLRRLFQSETVAG